MDGCNIPATKLIARALPTYLLDSQQKRPCTQKGVSKVHCCTLCAQLFFHHATVVDGEGGGGFRLLPPPLGGLCTCHVSGSNDSMK